MWVGWTVPLALSNSISSPKWRSREASGCELVLPVMCIPVRFGKWKEGISTLPFFHVIPGKQWALAKGSAGGGPTPCSTAGGGDSSDRLAGQQTSTSQLW